jgi:hypothetical protein
MAHDQAHCLSRAVLRQSIHKRKSPRQSRRTISPSNEVINLPARLSLEFAQLATIQPPTFTQRNWNNGMYFTVPLFIQQ